MEEPDILKSATLQRELGSPTHVGLQRSRRSRLGFTEAAAKKLSVEAILKGHRGCVNRLAWNEAGTLLASGSDDRQILVWRYPDTQRPPLRLETQHQANIFGVKFLPATSDRRLVSCAMDYTVQLHTLERAPLAEDAAEAPAPGVGVGHGGGRPQGPPSVATTVYTCHRGRVKCVEVEAGNPHLFWSASEDGTVRQFDTRVSTASQRDYSSPNALLALRGKAPGRLLEVKALALNRVAPHQLAVGAGDQYVRVYDRRMATLGAPRGPGSPQVEPLLKLAPPHLTLGQATTRPPSRMHTTCVAFGNRGDKVVATYHSDHVYAFDVSGAGGSPLTFRSPPGSPSAPPATAVARSPAAARGPSSLPPELRLDFFWGSQEAGDGVQGERLAQHSGTLSSGGGIGGAVGDGGGGAAGPPQILPPAAEAAKAEGNLHFFNKQHLAAIQQYSKAIQLAPWATVLYTNRALVLVHRGWEGDAAAALRDCEAALQLDPGCMKAHYRRAQALAACKMPKSAAAAARIFRRQFPEDAGEELAHLEEQISAELAQRAQREGRRQARRWQGMSLERRRNQQPGGSRGTATRVPTSVPEAGGSQMEIDAPGPAGAAAGSAEPSSVATSELAATDSSGPSSSAGTAGMSGSEGAGATVPSPPASTPPSAERPESSGAGESGAGGGADASMAQAPPAPAAAAASAAGAAAAGTAPPPQPRPPEQTGAVREPAAAGTEGAQAAVPVRARHAADSDSDSDWVDLWGGGSSDDEGGEEVLASALDVDQQYADALERAYQAAAEEQQRPGSSNGFIGPHPPPPPSLPQPSLWTAFEGGRRMMQRYIGQCNVQTDIKEATFLGPHDELVACGSDDGHVFIFNAVSGECVRVLQADDDVANCVQCHPHLPVLATSGIDHAIKVWSPEGHPTSGGNLSDIIQLTQDRMREGPTVLRGIDPRLLAALSDNPDLLRALIQRATRLGGSRQEGPGEEGDGNDEEEDEEEGRPAQVTCRMA